jgi:peroxiredoxin
MRRGSLPFVSAAVALVIAVVGWYGLSPRSTRVKAGDLAPDISLPHWNAPTARGTLNALRGSPVLLMFFDSSWPTSGAALEELEAVHRRFLRDGLVVVGVALDPPQEAKAVEFLLANRNVSFTVLVDPGGRASEPLYGLPPARRPETYLIDSTGRVISVHVKAEQWTRPDLRRRLAELLPPRVPTASLPPRPPGPSEPPTALDSPRPPG